MRRAVRLAVPLALGVAGLAPALGCSSLSDSARSTSKSTSGASSSSSDDQGEVIYMRQIRDYSYGYARSGGDATAFARGVGALAQRNGVHDWEGNEETCRAVGEGFRDAGSGKSSSERSFGQIVSPASECNFWMRAGYYER